MAHWLAARLATILKKGTQMSMPCITRRRFLASATGSVAYGTVLSTLSTGHKLSAWAEDAATSDRPKPLQLRYLLSSCLYGNTDLREVLPEVNKTGAAAIDLWPKPHGNHREQLNELGEERFRQMLVEAGIRLGSLTRYDLGPFRLADEIKLARRLGCPIIVTGAQGPVGLSGADLRQAVRDFVGKLGPSLDLAEEHAVTIAIENHGHSLINSPDSIRWLAEAASDRPLGVALAPYHLPQDENLIAALISDIGQKISVFYAWQHGKGCDRPMPLEDILLQLPGRGPLDFRPIVAALRKVDYAGYTSIFMHPYPRGRAIRETISEVTEELIRARKYLDSCLATAS